MQSNKTSKKTRKIAEEDLTAPISGTTEANTKPRTSRSSKLKVENSESGPARHRKASPASSESDVKENTTGLKALAAAAAASTASTSSIEAVASPVALRNHATSSHGVETSAAVPHEDIAALAHRYWIARGGVFGSAEQDWFRAEQELKAKRSQR